MNDIWLAELAGLQDELVQIVYALGERDCPVPVPKAACRDALGVDDDVLKHVMDRLETRVLMRSNRPPSWLQLTWRGVWRARKLKQIPRNMGGRPPETPSERGRFPRPTIEELGFERQRRS